MHAKAMRNDLITNGKRDEMFTNQPRSTPHLKADDKTQ